MHSHPGNLRFGNMHLICPAGANYQDPYSDDDSNCLLLQLNNSQNISFSPGDLFTFNLKGLKNYIRTGNSAAYRYNFSSHPLLRAPPQPV